MKVSELLELLSNLPPDRLDMDVFIDTGGDEYYDMTLSELKEDDTPVGYVFERAVHYEGTPHKDVH